MALHLYLTMWEQTASEWICTYIWPCENTPHQNGSALTSNHVRTHHIRMDLHLYPTSSCQKGSALTFNLILLERLYTYIWPCEEHIQNTCHKGSALTSDHVRSTSSIHVRKALQLHLTMWGTHPSYMSERLYTYIWPCEEHIKHTCQKGSALISDHVRNTSRNHARRSLHLHLTMWGAHTASMSEGLWTYIWPCGEHIPHPCQKGGCTYIWPCGEHILHPCQKGPALTSDHVGNTSHIH